MDDDEIPWLALSDVYKQYGYTVLQSARNAIVAGNFPVPTYKLGVQIVIDKEVHKEFFRQKREAGLAVLRHNRSGRPQHNRDK